MSQDTNFHRKPLSTAASKQARRLTEAGDDFKIEFTFIDGARPKEQRKKSRAHVTTQHYRRKRHEKAKQDSEGLVEPQAPHHTAIDILPTATSSIREPVLLNATEHPPTPTIPIPYYARGRSDPFAATTFPIPPDPSIHELVDHYCHVIPSLVHCHWNKTTRRSRSTWDLFDLYRRDPLSFTGILHHASQHLEGMRGHTHESPATTSWKLRSIAGIQARLASRSSPPLQTASRTSVTTTTTTATLESFAQDNALLIAIGLLANAERLWGSRAIARVHWAAVKRMLRARGGFPGLVAQSGDVHKVMHTKLLWSEIALSGTTAYLSQEELGPAYLDDFGVLGMSVPFGGSSSDGAKGGNKGDGFAFPAETALRLATDEFTQLINLRLSQERVWVRKSEQEGGAPSSLSDYYASNSPTNDSDTSHHRFFRPSSPLHTCLVPRATTRYAHPDKRRAHENCRLACLLLLNVVVADLGGTPQLGQWFEALLGVVGGEAAEQEGRPSNAVGRGREGTDAALTAEHLLWTLLSERRLGGEVERMVFERGWKVGRLQGVAKRLRNVWWQRVGWGLWRLLVGEIDEGAAGMGRGRGAGAGNGALWDGGERQGHRWWDAEEFVEEVRRSRTPMEEEDVEQ